MSHILYLNFIKCIMNLKQHKKHLRVFIKRVFFYFINKILKLFLRLIIYIAIVYEVKINIKHIKKFQLVT